VILIFKVQKVALFYEERLPLTDCHNINDIYKDSLQSYAIHQWENFIDGDNQNGNN
jgi:hypothetical protein